MPDNTVRDRIAKALARRETRLNLSELGLRKLPTNLIELTWLETLFISFNEISDIALLESLPALRSLDLRGNLVRSVQPLTRLHELEYLDLAGNGIREIGPLGSLSQLKTLYLEENRLADIQPLSMLSDLESLDVAHNDLADIWALEHKPKLTRLHLSNNRIADLSPLSDAVNLRKLDVHANRITDLTPLAACPELRAILFGSNRVRDLTPIAPLIERGLAIKQKRGGNNTSSPVLNPLTTPPPEIVANGNAAITRYYSEIARQGSARIYEAKLLIIGEGGAGKTTLARKIEDPASPLPDESETTMGIDVKRIRFMRVARSESFYLNIWDFGGQEIYHATHQFFLTHRSLYVLLDDTRKDDKNVHDHAFSYWLQVVELLGGESPLFIVQNEKSDRSKAIDLRSMQARFDFIKDCLATNLATNRGLDSVIAALKYWLPRLEHIGDTLPIQWIRVRGDLVRRLVRRKHISLTEYLQLCAEHRIPEEARALDLSRYLHDLGVFLHFQDHPILRNIIVLENSWATDAVYAILDDEEIKRGSGFFTASDLGRLWAGEDYERHQHELMALMEKFELCYKLRDTDSATWLAPQLLPPAANEAEIDEYEGAELVVRYEYDFMPKGILPRLIVRLNRYVRDAAAAWRAGVVLHRQDARALVTETYASREIRIQAIGEFSRQLMTIVTEEVDRINSGYRALRVEKMIPCNCETCHDSDTTHYYSYASLQERVRRGRRTVECDKSYNMLEVAALLEGVFARVVRKRNEDMTVFISYSHKDEKYRKKLDTHLAGLKLTRHLKVWDDTNIRAGDRWNDAIRGNLERADIVLLLVSADFIASRYVWEQELPIAVERDARGDAIVIPVFLRPCDTTDLPFMNLQGLPRNGKPVSAFKNEDDGLTEVAKGIRRRLNMMERQ